MYVIWKKKYDKIIRLAYVHSFRKQIPQNPDRNRFTGEFIHSIPDDLEKYGRFKELVAPLGMTLVSKKPRFGWTKD